MAQVEGSYSEIPVIEFGDAGIANHEALKQLGFADIIILNKTDLVSGPALEKLEQRHQHLNPTAGLHHKSKVVN
jgi:G3E family GTPase